MFTPNKGSVESINGSKAQCMAQAIEVAIPILRRRTRFDKPVPIEFCIHMKCKGMIFAILLQVLTTRFNSNCRSQGNRQ